MKKIHIHQIVESRSNGNNSADLVHQGNNPLAFIQMNNFLSAIESIMNDVKLDPYILTYKLLQTFYSGNERISIEDFKKFFARFETYF